MKLSKTLWCVSFIVTAVFSMPAFAFTPVGQIDPLDAIVATGWTDYWSSGYMIQELVAEVNEGIGSMKLDFTTYPGVSPYTDKTVCKPQRTVVLDLDYLNHAITLWVWSGDLDDSRSQTSSSRLQQIHLYDSTVANAGPARRLGKFTVPPLANVGWNKVIAPLKNFMWQLGDPLEVMYLDPNQADWADIRKIRFIASCGGADPCDAEAIYLDDLRLELAPTTPDPRFDPPCQISACDDLVADLWDELRSTGAMLQIPIAGDANFYEGTGSMKIDFPSTGTPDICPSLYPIPALSLSTAPNDYNDWAVTLWLWTEQVGDEKLKEIILHDVEWNLGRFRIPFQLNQGWNYVVARLDEFLWNETGEDAICISPDEVRWDAFYKLEIWTEDHPLGGEAIYLDDFQIEVAVEALTEAVVQNVDYAPIGTMTIDGNAIDWADLKDSDIIDFDLAAIPDCNGDLHVKYRFAWDANYFYILVEEETGDTQTTEAVDQDNFIFDEELDGITNYWDSIALFFDFTNNRWPGIASHISFYLFLGLGSNGQDDLIYPLVNGLWSDQGGIELLAVEHAEVATSGTRPNRVIEAKIMWSDIDDHVDPYRLPDGGLKAKVNAKPGSGYIFGCDVRLCDSELILEDPHPPGSGWDWIGHGQPSGRDPNSRDVRLVWSAGDIDYDRDVDFVDFAQFAAEWFETGCTNLDDFCNGADIVINGDVGIQDLAKFAARWMDN